MADRLTPARSASLVFVVVLVVLAATHAAAQPAVAVAPSVSTGHRLAVGMWRACAVRQGETQCWGGPEAKDGHAWPITAARSAVAVAVGLNHACAVLPSGAASCWTLGIADAFGLGRVLPVSDAVDVVSGSDFACALEASGQVQCWGAGDQLGRRRAGDGDVVPPLPPAPAELPGPAALIAASDMAGAAYVGDRVFVWGKWAGNARTRNPVECEGKLASHGQLERALPGGRVDEWFCRQPAPIARVADVRELAMGSAHLCTRSGDGAVACLGSNPHGALGDGTKKSRAGLATVVGLPPAARLCAGGWHTCAVSRDGHAWCWGDNRDGALGDGTTVDRTRPTRVAGLTDVVDIACGAELSCALLASDEVKCWGSSWPGSLGPQAQSGDSVARPISTLPPRP
jgi:alpha-tubulin suppressor-like RCC1 family protein